MSAASDASCVFCAIVAGGAPASVIDEDSGTLAFLDINPFARGHSLVVPRRHEPDLYGLRPDECGSVLAMAVRVASRLRAVLQPDGVNLFHATGVAAFQSVFHLHLHVVPRWADDGVRLPFTPTPVARDELDGLADELRRAVV